MGMGLMMKGHGGGSEVTAIAAAANLWGVWVLFGLGSESY